MPYSFKGAISFGLVYIPVVLVNSIKQNDIGFNMIDKKTMSRIKYKKTCLDCDNKEVKNEDIVKGYQYEKGKYVIFEEDDFEKLKSPKDKTIDIEQFVDLAEVDPVYFDKTYYVQPSGADKAFCVFIDALKKSKKAGIAKTVLGTKQALILIRAKEDKLILQTMFFEEEVQPYPAYKKAKVEKQELELAVSLIDKMSGKFEPEAYKDDYNLKVKEAIKKKIAGKEIISEKPSGQPEKIVNIIEALKKSLANTARKAN